MFHPKEVNEILITKEQIQKRIKELGSQITADYRGKNPLVVGVLKGSWIFLADLVRQIDLGCTIDFIDISTYGSGTRSSGEVRFNKDFDYSIDGKDIIMVEDIIDTGITMNFIQNLLKTRGAASVKIASLLSKPERRKVEISIDYLGFEIPDKFVIGYGLDYAEKYRGLEFIGVLHEECYK